MATRNTSFELTIGKHEDELECSLTRPDYQGMDILKLNLPLDPKANSDITASFNKVKSLARREPSPEKLSQSLAELGIYVGRVLEPILKHFDLIERKGKECLNLTLKLDKYTVKIPWELAAWEEENDDWLFLCVHENENLQYKQSFQKKYA